MRSDPWLRAEQARGPLPAETDVAIVGGGLAGTATAYYLAREGVDVVLLERSELNREASGTNAGSFHFQIAIHQLTARETESSHARLLSDVRMHSAAAELWGTLEDDLDASLGVHTTGGLMVAETPEELQILHDKHLIEAEAGLETHVLEGDELRRLAPYLADDLAGASFCPSEGHANPFLAAPLFALRAAERGAVIRTQTEVTGVASGFRIETTNGTLRANRIVNAAGAWANDLAALSGVRLPLRVEGLHVNVTEPRQKVLEPLIQHIGRRLTLKQAANGTFIIGGGWPAHPEARPSRFSTLWESAAGNAAVAVRVMPSLADVRIVRMWTGVMAFTDDLQPVVGELSSLPGYYTCIATTGFTLSPMLARLLAGNIARGVPLPPRFAPDRKGRQWIATT
ncbi:MAG: FAD-binding oxidoreductase [Thermoleophilia bacterium]|nr:FAD-binding oxidoreductase [Thermoleophilia bacterium]